MASTWSKITSSPQFNSFSPEQQDNVRRDYFTKYPTKEDLQDELYRQADMQGVDRELASSIATIESNWDPQARSPKNAAGIMQIIPNTAIKLAKRIGKSPEDIISNPSFNIEAGIHLLKYLGDKYNGDVKKIASAYNWGEGNVDKIGLESAPLETRNYIRKLEKALGRTATTADVPYGMGKAGPRKVQAAIQGEPDLESIRNISPNTFKTSQEPTIPDTWKNTSGVELNEAPIIRGENEDNSFDIALKPTLGEVEAHDPWDYTHAIPSPMDVGEKLLGDLPQKGQKLVGQGIKLIGGMHPASAIPASLAGQYIEEGKAPSLTQAVVDELVSPIPGGHGLVKGSLTGLAQSVISSFVNRGELPSLQEALQNGMLGSLIGKFLPNLLQRGKLHTGDGPDIINPKEDIGIPRDITPTIPQSKGPFLENKYKAPTPQQSSISNRRQGQLQIEDNGPVRTYIAPIRGKKVEDVGRGKSGPTIPQEFKKDAIAKDPFNEKIASQFKEGRGRANEFGQLKTLEEVGDNPKLQEQSQKLKNLGSTQNDFGQIEEIQRGINEPPPPRIREPGKPTLLRQIESQGSPSPIPSFPKENVLPPQVQARKERLNEILSQYEANLKKGPQSPAKILPPGPPSHLASIRNKIEEMRSISPKPFNLKEAVEDVHKKVLPQEESPLKSPTQKKQVTTKPKASTPSPIPTNTKDRIKEELAKLKIANKKTTSPPIPQTKTLPMAISGEQFNRIFDSPQYKSLVANFQKTHSNHMAHKMAARKLLGGKYPEELITAVLDKLDKVFNK